MRGEGSRTQRRRSAFAPISAAAVWLAAALFTVPAARPQTSGTIRSRSSTLESQLVCFGDFPKEISLAHPVGCEKWDCCALCPGPPDWSVHVGREASMVLLRFRDLSASARRRLKIAGDAKWDPDGRLRLGPGETTIRGFQPDANGRWPSAWAAAVLAPVPPGEGPSPERRRRQVEERRPETRPFLTVRYSRGGDLVGERQLALVDAGCRNRPTAPHDKVAVASYPESVLVFDPGASGDAPPARVIRGLRTGLENAAGVGADGAGNIYALNAFDLLHHVAPNSILVFGPAANGDVAPIRAIRPSAIGERWAFGVGLAVDDAGTAFLGFGDTDTDQSVMIFPPGASGDVAPSQVLLVNDLTDPAALAVNRAGTRLFVAGHEAIHVYEKDPAGRFARANDIRVSVHVSWESLATAPDGTLYALDNEGTPTIFLFESAPGGGYRGAGRAVYFPRARAIAVGRDFLYVAIGSDFLQPQAIDVFSSRVTGPSSALGSIQGPNTQIHSFEGICVVPAPAAQPPRN